MCACVRACVCISVCVCVCVSSIASFRSALKTNLFSSELACVRVFSVVFVVSVSGGGGGGGRGGRMFVLAVM